MEPRKRQHGLDGIKLLGMYLVILYHVVFPHMPDVVDAPTAVGYLRYFLETFLGCCVPLFFMASGALALKKPVANYSLGMRQRLGIAQAIMEDPKLLILDEPFNGLDKHGVGEIRKLLLELKEEGKTILLASHNEEDIRILCDEVYEMDGGVLRKFEDEIRK